MRLYDTPRHGGGAQLLVQGGRYGPGTVLFRKLRITSAKPPAPTEETSQRYAVCIEAIVVGLASVELPLVICDVSRRGMSLAFANYAAAIDPRRAVGARRTRNPSPSRFLVRRHYKEPEATRQFSRYHTRRCSPGWRCAQFQNGIASLRSP